MKLGWLDPITYFEANGGADGGGGAPAPSPGGDGPAADTTTQTETGREAASETPASVPVEAEAPDIDFPEILNSVFVPRGQDSIQPDRGYHPAWQTAPGPAAPPQPPPAELWQLEPEKAAAQLQAYTEHKIKTEVMRATQPVEEMKRGIAEERNAKFRDAAAEAKAALPEHYKAVFNRDKDFRSNPKLQKQTEAVIGEFVAAALNSGQISDLKFITTKSFAKRALAMAKCDIDEAEAFSVHPSGGPTVVGRQGMKQASDHGLDEEVLKGLKDASEWAGKEYTPAAIAAAQKRRDSSDW